MTTLSLSPYRWVSGTAGGAIDLDIDRQNITRFGSPSRIEEHVAEIVETLGDPAGGLMLKFGLFHGTPIENVKAVMDAMEKASVFFS